MVDIRTNYTINGIHEITVEYDFGSVCYHWSSQTGKLWTLSTHVAIGVPTINEAKKIVVEHLKIQVIAMHKQLLSMLKVMK